MKRWLVLLLICIIANTTAAYAAKARLIDSDSTSEFHAFHLQRHIGENSCHATGNYIKTRAQSNKSKVIGHLEQADAFELIALEDGYALIKVLNSHKTSPDSWNGMTGWVNSDYIDCTCSTDEYNNYFLSATSGNVSTKLDDYINTSAVTAAVNKLRVRNTPNGKILGRIGKSDEFNLLAVQDGWAQITVTKASSSDAWKGLSGWVSTEYLEVKNAPLTHSSTITDYSSVLDFFYQAISEKWDSQRIVDADFEPWEFPDNLYTSGFAYWDINNDGIEELFIFRNPEAEIGSIIAGYTLVNEQPVRIFSSWARSRNYLCTDGSIYNEGSNGAAYSVYYIYDLIGSQMKVREGVLSGDYEENGETKYGWFLVDERADFTYFEHKLISEQYAEEKIAFYQSSIVRFENIISFAQYK